MFIVTYRKVFYIISGLIVLGSIATIMIFGFKLGIDFTGGTIIETSYTERPALSDVQSAIDNAPFKAEAPLGAYTLRPTGNNKYSVTARSLSPDEQQLILKALSLNEKSEMKIERVNSIGPVIGSELKRKSYIAITVVILAIVTFVAFAFRKVSRPVSSWKYGLVTIAALVHDVVVPAGIFVLYSHFTGAQVDLLFVTAILALLGYSVSDTIVVFDRVRENLRHAHSVSGDEFEKLVGASLSQTFIRSLNTSFTVFLMLLALFFFGMATTQDFIFVLLVGTIAGTYSSLFLAAPLLVTLEKLQKRDR